MTTEAPAVPAAAPTPAAPAETQPGTTAVPGAETAPPAPEKTFTQKELDDILEKRLSKERRKREELRQERDVLRRLALDRGGEKREDPPARAPQQQQPQEPKREEFDSYEKFVEARAEWRAEQSVEKRFKERDEKDARTRTESQQKKEAEEFRASLKGHAKDIEDFEEVMAETAGVADHPVARLAADPIRTADNPAKVLYHLAKNPDEAERIASLSVVQQAREIVKLEAKLAAEPPPKKPSSAPEPLTPVGGKVTAADAEPDPVKDQAGWLKWRNASIKAKKTGTH